MHTQPKFIRAICLLSYLALAVACGGEGSGTPSPPDSTQPPTGLSYGANPAQYRADEQIADNVATLGGGDPPTQFSVAPALPSGLALDQATGTITGTPDTPTAAADYVVTAENDGGTTNATVNIAVGAALPAVFEFLLAGFDAEVVYEDPAPAPVKLARIAIAPPPDGRIFFAEVDTGNIRIFDPGVGLIVAPFATVNVLTGGHNGLLGLALAPDFATSGHVYAMACVPAGGGQNDRMKVFRWTDVNNVGTNEMTVLDDLPITPPGGVNNGGDIAFDLNGFLFVSIGDVQDPANSQVPAGTSLAGKVLRYDVSSLPAQPPAAGQPFAGSPEWVRGLRNTYGLAVHPTAGGLFGAENGPAANDELNFLQPGKNYEWQNATPPPGDIGFKIKNYPTVIVPTALAWHDGTDWGPDFANNLFMTTYEDHTIERFEMSGAAFTDIDDESEFARFHVTASDNHPLDIEQAGDGSLYVSTFTGIYRITKAP